MRSVTAAVSHRVPERPPLQLAVGDEVVVGERSAEWPAFVFVTAAGGSGWVPSRHLSGSRGRTLVEQPYDTTELATAEGERLDVLGEDLESDWLWCRSRTGRQGWVPLSTLCDGE